MKIKHNFNRRNIKTQRSPQQKKEGTKNPINL